MNPSLLRISFRYIKQHLLQSVLLALGIALGVAVIIAVDLANKSANRSFSLSSESLVGRATHQIIGGPSGIDENLYRRLRIELSIKNSAPVVEGYVTAIELNYRTMHLLGVDPFAESRFRNLISSQNGRIPLKTLTAFLTEPDSVLISEELARRVGLVLGSDLTLKHGSRFIKVRIVGLLQPQDELSRHALGGVLIADLSTAQEILNQTGKLSRIDLIIDTASAGGKDTLRDIGNILPEGAYIELPEVRTNNIQQMSKAFQLNLFALSLLAIVIGVFLIYNTITFSVVQRRPILGTLRALGVTRGQIFTMIIIETVILGVVGAVLGLALGTVLGRGIVHLVTRTISDLYFTLTVTDFSVSPQSLFKGAFIGISASAISAVLPAWEAAYVSPAQAIRRSELESRIMCIIPWISTAGLCIVSLGGFLLLLPLSRLDIGFGALFAILIGSALFVPIGTIALMYLVMPLSRKLPDVIARMALRSIVRSLSRTAPAIAALMIAVSVIVSVNIMIGSFRKTVVDWLESTITADIFITIPAGNISGNQGFSPRLAQEISEFPAIREVATARRVQINTPKYGLVNLVAVTEDIATNRRFAWTEGGRTNVWEKFRRDEVFISESFAYHHNIRGTPDATIQLRTDRGVHDFDVAGIYYDYASQNGTVLMADSVYRKFWNDSQISSIAAFIESDYKIDSVIEGLEARFAGRYSLIVQSNRDLRLSALNVFDRTFTITGALRLLAAIVAFIGVFSALMSLELERIREIGVLRAVGMTTSQVSRMIFFETGLIGFTAGLMALPVGTILALILVHVINLRSFGWTLEFVMRAEYFLEALAIAVIAAVLAGIYPALSFGRTKITDAIRME
ncbi:MAG TPA: FtsX-like permease family protein [Thermodesulfobacteriota bacterium]|nr:FtsX-like permease family protein [Thermodesulfobacteriota bacterium]